MPDSVYLAGSYAAKERLREVAQEYMHKGISVTSNWLWWEPTYLLSGVNLNRAIFDLDYTGVKIARCLVLDTTEVSTKGGYLVELGIALGLKKPIYLVGPDLNAFFSGIEFHYKVKTHKEVIDLICEGI